MNVETLVIMGFRNAGKVNENPMVVGMFLIICFGIITTERKVSIDIQWNLSSKTAWTLSNDVLFYILWCRRNYHIYIINTLTLYLWMPDNLIFKFVVSSETVRNYVICIKNKILPTLKTCNINLKKKFNN